MTSMYLTAYKGQILGPIARVLGWIMNWVYIGLSNVFGIKDIWVTIVVFTIIIYMALLPLTVRQQKFSMLQQKISPEIKAIQKKYKGKRDQASMMAQQEEQQALYDKYGISPMGSCLQMAIQLPILFGLYRVIYNIPAYISDVKGVFSGLATQIMGVNGYAELMQTIYKNAKINTVQVDFTTTDPAAMSNYIIDVLYKLGDSGWSALQTSFPTLTSAIDSTHSAMMKVNYFLNLNISETPWNLIKQGFFADQKDWALVIVALLIPIASYFFQFLSMKLMPTAGGGSDQMEQQMKMMNTMMPLISLVIGFTLPVGFVLYWIIGSIVRVIQQYFLNKHFEKMDLEQIIKKNEAKAKAKAAKRGARREQITSAATTNARRSMSSKAGISSEKQEALNRAAMNRAKAGKNSLASKANRVQRFNNNQKDNDSE
mgnify:CR=1 FL=1